MGNELYGEPFLPSDQRQMLAACIRVLDKIPSASWFRKLWDFSKAQPDFMLKSCNFPEHVRRFVADRGAP
jgi:hypothetical protein